jgi:PKD repeat protein
LTYAWDFTNDGTVDSTLPNPSYSYPAAGTYTVNLTVRNIAGSDSEIKTDYITVTPAPVAPVASFSGTPQTGNAPLSVQFTSSSTGTAPLTYAWDFTNDGTVDSTLPNPSYSYPAAGTYTVNLTVQNIAGSDSEIKTGYITVTPAPVAPVSEFTGTPTTGDTPLSVQFIDHSTGTITSYAWDFGDTVTSYLQNPEHIYTAAGNYSVNLTVSGPGGSSSKLRTNYITASTPPMPEFLADFKVSPTTGIGPLTVKCTDKSTGNPTWFAYDFGDGVTMYGPNPAHTYTLPGVYNITLTVMKFDRASFSMKISSTTKQNVVTVNRVPFTQPVAKFTAWPVQGTPPLTVAFSDQSSGDPTFYNYDFGDGVNITGPNPVHTYRYPGTYTVTLTVLKNDAATGTIASDSFIQKELVVVQG